MKKFLLISLMTINIPILSMLRTQGVATLLLRNSTIISRTISTPQPSKELCITQKVKKDSKLTTALVTGSSTATGVGIGWIYHQYTKERNADKKSMSETEEPDNNNNDSDHD